MYMSTNRSELPQKSLQIEEDDKFFSRLLSKESSASSPSLRVLYYGGVSGAVPFMWESRPGTPKHSFSHTADLLLPLTPPPSYYSNSNKKLKKKRSRSNPIHALFPKICLKKSITTLSPSPSSASISSTWSSPLDPSLYGPIINAKFHGMKRLLSHRSSFDSREDDGQERALGSPTSTLMCFGIGRKRSGAELRGRNRL